MTLMTRKLGGWVGKGRELEKSHREGSMARVHDVRRQLKTWDLDRGRVAWEVTRGGTLGKPCSPRAGVEQEEVRVGRKGGGTGQLWL